MSDFYLDKDPIWIRNNKLDIFNNCMFTPWNLLDYTEGGSLYSQENFNKLLDTFNAALLSGKKIVFDLPNECYQSDYINMITKIVEYFIKNHNYSIDNFMYISGSLPITSNVIKYNFILNEYLPKLILSNNLEIEFSDAPWLPDTHFLDVKKPKMFVSMNGVPRSHRIALTILLNKMGLIDNSFYSIKSHSVTKMVKVFHKFLDIAEYTSTPGYLLSVDFKNDDSPRGDRLREEDVFYFDNSYFSLVQETLFCDKGGEMEHYDCQFITEKTFRPMIYRHPFILSGKYQALAALQEYGYKTFHPFIDESYDNIRDDCDRLEAIANEVKRLCNLSHGEWSTIYKQISPILDFNYERLSSSKLTFKVQNETIS